jgi:hypothetical protein
MDACIWYLIKFFNKEEHADEFIKGNLYLNRLSYFKKLEQSEDGRPDHYEAVTHWWQPHDLIIQLDVPGVGAVELTGKDFATPVSMQIDYHDHLHIFCMYTIRTFGFEAKDGKFEGSPEEMAVIQDQLAIDPEVLKFGAHAVVVQAPAFIERAKKALSEQAKANTMNLVEYYDDETFHGQIETKKVPFMKQKKFSYQNEFRICVDTKQNGDNHLIIPIGNLADISAKLESSKLHEVFKFNIEPT